MELLKSPETGEPIERAAEVHKWTVQLVSVQRGPGRPRIIRDGDGVVELVRTATEEDVWDLVAEAQKRGDEIEGRRIIARGLTSDGECIALRDVDDPPERAGMSAPVKAKTVEQEAVQAMAHELVLAMKQQRLFIRDVSGFVASFVGATVNVVEGSDGESEIERTLGALLKDVTAEDLRAWLKRDKPTNGANGAVKEN